MGEVIKKGRHVPKVSVIIPSYNRAHMIEVAINSVLNQTYDDWELVIVDDGSQDSTEQVVAHYHDERIRYIYQNNQKLPGARNTGIENSIGDYVAFLDSDDFFLPNKLEIQTRVLNHNPELGLVASGWIVADNDNNLYHRMEPWYSRPSLSIEDWLFSCPVIVNAILVRRQWLIKVGLFDGDQHFVEDWDLWLRLAYAGCQMNWEPAIVCAQTFHTENMVRQVEGMMNGMRRMLDKFFNQPELTWEIITRRDQAYANIYINGTARAYASGAIDNAKAWLKKAIDYDPEILHGYPPKVLDNLVSFSLTPLVKDEKVYVETIANNLPKIETFPYWTSRRMESLLNAIKAFSYYNEQEFFKVLRHTFLALLFDPAWIYNRGLLSITMKSFGGLLTKPIRLYA